MLRLRWRRSSTITQQVSAYLDITETERGLIVLANSGLIIPVARTSAATAGPQISTDARMSSLAWIDFDEAERQRTQRIMALFQERESRDELGLGAIRDSIADHLFPGTSTIQTRLGTCSSSPGCSACWKREVPESQLRTEAARWKFGSPTR